MLSGIQSQIQSMFPALRELTPDADEFKAGEDKERFGRLIEISGYKTEIFDMHSPKDVSAYNKLMLKLSKLAQTGKVRILVHDRQIMSRNDGSTGWFSYLEWMEYSWTEKTKGKDADNKEQEEAHGEEG